MIVDQLIDKLPSLMELGTGIAEVSTLKRDGITDMRAKVQGYYQQVTEVLDHLGGGTERDELRWEPEQLYMYLSMLRETIGGLQGIVIALNRRVKFFAFEDLSNSSKTVGEKQRSYTDKEKEMYARSETADLEGIETALETLYSALGDRLYTLRSSVKGAWH